ncbi:ATP-binding protein [Nocardiopsis sp. NPDC006198]|uniref:ATP-binding protein n=1 Tax=Nocardiopsis sp. NPDC006198 TaxID=3154472 RepID=UPI0033BC16CD
MTIVPQPSTASPTPATPGPRWEPRLYPGTLATTSRVRSDLRTDLARLAGIGPDLVETVVLCASEMFANAVEHSRSGEDDGRVIRTLSVPAASLAGTALRLSIIDDGARVSRPRIPRQRTREEWQEAERGRGLLLVDHLATAWGTRAVVDFPFCEGLGTVIWAEFTLSPSSWIGDAR